MSLADDAQELARPWLDHPATMGGLYAEALRRTFVRVDTNNDFRKLMTSTLAVVWAVVTLGVAFKVAAIDYWIHLAMTALVMIIIGLQWGVEVDALGPLEISYNDDE